MGRFYGGLDSRVGDSDTERLLRLLLQVVHKHQDLQRAGALAGGEAQADGVALSPAHLNTAEQCFTFIPGLPQAHCDFYLSMCFYLFTFSQSQTGQMRPRFTSGTKPFARQKTPPKNLHYIAELKLLRQPPTTNTPTIIKPIKAFGLTEAGESTSE